ncbi:MAG: PQQ-binding-like beta-propeller repeat protein [Kiritimatiellae bacterium]|nr:PQQ-binding-like beta-propeller repeat protein [Kiritimatiellia bacterium]
MTVWRTVAQRCRLAQRGCTENAVWRVGVCLALCAAVWAGPARGDDWPYWRGPNRDGFSTEAGWLTRWPPEPLWTRALGEGYSAVAVSEGRLYTMGYDAAAGRDVVWCLDAETGAELWRYTYTCGLVDYNGPRATPTVDGNEVYTFSHEGHLHCLNKVSGALLWSTLVNFGRPFWGMASSPLVEGNRIVLSAGGAGAAVNKNPPHNIVWSTAGTTGYASAIPVEYNGVRSVAMIGSAGIYGLAPDTGRTNWWFAYNGNGKVADPVLCGDKLFISSRSPNYSVLLQLGSGALAPAWELAPLYTDTMTTLRVGDYLYGSEPSGLVKCIEISTGAQKWSTRPFGRSGEVAMSGAEGRLLALHRKGKLDIVLPSPTGYNTEGRQSFLVTPDADSQDWWTMPVLSGGRIYCRSEEGTLVCLRIGAGPESAVAGTVSYAGAASGALAVGVFADASLQEWVGHVELAGPGAYEIQNLFPGTYYVAAVLATSGRRDQIKAADPWGAYRSTADITPVSVGPTQTLAGLDFELVDPGPGERNPLATWVPANDFDGDGKSDIALYDPALGTWYFLRSRDGFTTRQFGYGGTLPITGDFDGDGLCDYGVHWPPGGNWYFMRSTAGFAATCCAAGRTVPVTGDFDADGLCDYGAYYAARGNWFFMKSSAGYARDRLGSATAIPVAADFDGDAQCDFGVYDPPTGIWSLQRSLDGPGTLAFGYWGTVPVNGDFDGDGRHDIAVYDMRNGAWYFLNSTAGFSTVQFGFGGTVPVVGDYDGDGRDDYGVYYAPGGNWYLMRSTAGFVTVAFGYGGTLAIGAAHTTATY